MDERTKSLESLSELLQRSGFNLNDKTNCIIQIS